MVKRCNQSAAIALFPWWRIPTRLILDYTPSETFVIIRVIIFVGHTKKAQQTDFTEENLEYFKKATWKIKKDTYDKVKLNFLLISSTPFTVGHWQKLPIEYNCSRHDV